MTNQLSPFHVAVPVYDLEEARNFYCEILGCTEGRTSDHWIDLNFFGHQFVLHLKPRASEQQEHHTNPVDGHDVPIPHYGVVLTWEDWQELADRLRNLNVQFILQPGIRFIGQPGEQATMFFLDPSGNALEFKAFKDMAQLFAK